MTLEQITQLHRFIKFYGEGNQIIKAIEECAELQKELTTDFLTLSQNSIAIDVDSLSSEIADVTIMLEQLKIMFNCSESVEDWIDYKIKRQIERMAKK